MHSVTSAVRVEIRDDRVLTLGFHEWLAKQKDMFSLHGGAGGGDWYVGVFDAVHDVRIKRFFATAKRVPCPECIGVKSDECETCWGTGVVIATEGSGVGK